MRTGWSGWPGVASLGTRPMVGGTQMLLEAHLFDFAGDLYGRELEVEFVAHLRDEAEFPSMDAMVEQMQRDAERGASRIEGEGASGLQGHDQSAADRLSDEGRSGAARAGTAATLGASSASIERIREVARGRPPFRAARWAALRQRRDPSRPRGQQDSQGHRRQVAHAGWPRCAVSSRAGTATACRSSWRWKRNTAGRARSSMRAALSRRLPCVCECADRSQRSDFKRLGVFGDWEHPYLTMDPRYEAQQIRALGKIIRNGHLYRGAKPVHWCLDCRSALAEAEVEYEDKTSTAIDVAFRVLDRGRFRAPNRYRGGASERPGIAS